MPKINITNQAGDPITKEELETYMVKHDANTLSIDLGLASLMRDANLVGQAMAYAKDNGFEISLDAIRHNMYSPARFMATWKFNPENDFETASEKSVKTMKIVCEILELGEMSPEEYIRHMISVAQLA